VVLVGLEGTAVIDSLPTVQEFMDGMIDGFAKTRSPAAGNALTF